MTIDLAGPSVFLVFTIVAICEPAAVTYRINLAATSRVVAPPKPSSTYEPKTAEVWKRWLSCKRCPLAEQFGGVCFAEGY